MEAQLVITGPAPFAPELAHATRCRSTMGVLVQLVASAEHDIVIASPYIQEDIFAGTFGDAVRSALERNVVVNLLSTQETLARAEMRRLIAGLGQRINLYFPAFPDFETSQLGSHAKFCLGDSQQAYIGSANLTKPGLSKHFELGVLVRGDAAKQMRAFWDFAIRFELFRLYAPQGA